jgi:hypothetical protein
MHGKEKLTVAYKDYFCERKSISKVWLRLMLFNILLAIKLNNKNTIRLRKGKERYYR